MLPLDPDDIFKVSYSYSREDTDSSKKARYKTSYTGATREAEDKDLVAFDVVMCNKGVGVFGILFQSETHAT